MEVTIPNLSPQDWVFITYFVGVVVTFFVAALLSRYNVCDFDDDPTPPAIIVILAWPLAIILSILFGIFMILTILWTKLANR